MDAAEVTEVCRLCPVNNTKLISVFDERFSGKNNMKEVILVTTGIEVLKDDEISVKICDRCSNITLKMFKFRQDAILQDKSLRERRNQLIAGQEIHLPNTDVRIKREIPSTSVKNTKKDLDVHHSITQMYKVFPTLKLPRICVSRDMAPFVSLPMEQVEKYFKDKKLNINQYIWKSPPTSIKSISNRVAKKRVSMPTPKKKTVTPLKISKKHCKPHEKSNETSDSYFCTPVNEEQTRKRSSSCDSGVKIKLRRESITGCSNNISEDPVTPLRVTIPLVKHTTPVVDQSEDSRDSVTTIKSTATSSGSNAEAYQHDYLESFGLTPTVTTMKSQTQLVCNLCGSVHNNASELKRHTLKHMVCQFCKRRFKSLENKNHHVDNICEIKKIMTSSGPQVHLTKVDLDLETRKKYMEAFIGFEPIPGLMKPEEVVVRAASPPQAVHQYNIIVLSDDDDDKADPLSGTPTAEIMSAVNTISHLNPEPVIFNSSIVRPDIKIKTDDIISEFFGNNNEKEVTKGLLRRCNAVKITVDKIIQTDLPASKDIKIKPDASCEFRNLKDHIVPYKVPIHLINGSFNVAYKFDIPSKSANKMGAWHCLPIVDVKNRSANLQIVVANSKPVASSSAPIELLVSLKNKNPQPSLAQSNNEQDSPTPRLQTYFDRAPNAALPRKPLPIPKQFLTKNSSNASKSMLTANTPVSQSLNKHIGQKKSGNTSISHVALNNSNNKTSQPPPNTLLGELLDRRPTCASDPMSEGISAIMKNLPSNIPHSNSSANKLKNCIPLPKVSTNQVFVNNTKIPNNGRTSNNQMGVSTNSFTPSTTTSLNNPIIQNILVLSPNQQKNGNYSSSVTSNTLTNVYISPVAVPNIQGNLNLSASLIPNAQTNSNPPLLIPNNIQRNINYLRSTTQNTQNILNIPASVTQNTQTNVIPLTSATSNTQRNVNPPISATRNTQISANSSTLTTQNIQMNVDSPALTMQNTQRDIPPLTPHRNALMMPNTQRSSTYSVEPARFRVKDIRELQ